MISSHRYGQSLETLFPALISKGHRAEIQLPMESSVLKLTPHMLLTFESQESTLSSLFSCLFPSDFCPEDYQMGIYAHA